ncbi:hypothetical protein B0H14DRAFT_2650427 [Mycena olivaceomarginata]|nr:hypothetical protein B0H14DRAFT_2650427 [Mycena olivaceomarginata]
MTRVPVGSGRRSQLSARNRPGPLAPQTQTQTPTTSGSKGRASPGAPLRVRGRRWGGRGRGRRGRRGAARGDELFGEEDARVVDFLFFLLFVLSDSELRRREPIDLGLPVQLSQLDVQLPRARAYERRDGDTAASPRAAYPGARGVARRLAAPMHHPHCALRERVRVLVYALPIERGVRHGGGRDERREDCARELVAEKEEAVGEGGACEASDEQGHSDESGEGGGEQGAQMNLSGGGGRGALVLRREGQVRPEQRRVDAGRGADALGRRTGTWKGGPPPHDERCRAVLELAEHQAHARGICGGGGGEVMQILRGLFALQDRVVRRCAEGESEGRGGGSKSSAAEMRARNSARLKGGRRAGDVDDESTTWTTRGSTWRALKGETKKASEHGVI